MTELIADTIDGFFVQNIEEATGKVKAIDTSTAGYTGKLSTRYFSME